MRFQEGTDSFGETLDLSTINGTYNGELAPFIGDTYASGFALDFMGLPITGTLHVKLPPVVDVNGNGFDDFFEVALGVDTIQTSGSYQTPIGGGSVTATWSRAARSKDGSCVLHLVDNTYGDLDFRHTFSREYTVIVTPGTNSVSGASMAQTGNAAKALQGPVQFVKLATDRFNRLTLQGDLDKPGPTDTDFMQDAYLRDTAY